MFNHDRSLSISSSLFNTLLHALITLIAVAIPFALPEIARYILFSWWPQVEDDSQLLLATEILLAATLVLMVNLGMLSWHNRRLASSARVAALVHARARGGPFARWLERHLVRAVPSARDAFVLAVTGFHTFVDNGGFVGRAFKTAYEIRVLLVDPSSEGARQRVSATPSNYDLAKLRDEIEQSISCLDALRQGGKKVRLKFYSDAPFWKVVVLGDYVWVQYCHDGCEVRHTAEFAFALNKRNPHQGLFVPFYKLFLAAWGDPGHPEYDFERRELVYRDMLGNETHRDPFMPQPAAA